ncbi:hypothetical protein [Sphingobacterium griseoflavum]|uniref:Uncharacterized protein n=1 Tax=Sphingobacterium griseoflavum TaxID=1474952 RepID=A0ABQ3HW37_9SPHI|nr:hypothetical protein [Sphingobacterium griseoflavum]GHE30387.1 hypothetical protein GCM10017764_11630 [Sphingobacterium griseoflavum]
MMNRFLILFMAASVFGCGNPRYEPVSNSWTDNEELQAELEHTLLADMQEVSKTLHGTEVKIRGKLVYEYDDAAIYPFDDCSDYKPIWIHVDHESDLHSFLLQNDDALVTIVGVVDTMAYFDRRQYGSAIKDIARVDVRYSLAQQ